MVNVLATYKKNLISGMGGQRFMNKALKIYTQEIRVFQKQRAKVRGLIPVHCGAVTFIQRFGSALNLNIHFHTLVPDGVFYKVKDEYCFYQFRKPSYEELAEIRLGVDPECEDTYSANIEGFSLNASVGVQAKDRKRLEQLIRYMARGPLATERLSEVFPNQLIYKMKSPWRDGTTHVSFSYLDFIARLVALIPPPRMNMVRYHGCFAPNFKDRKLIIEKPRQSVKSDQSCAVPLHLERVKRERLKWAEMLKKTFKIDVTVCPRCSGRMEQIAVIKDRATAKKILGSMGEQSLFRPLKVVKDRGPPEVWEVFIDDFDQRDSTW